jgi:large repetitive protein
MHESDLRGCGRLKARAAWLLAATVVASWAAQAGVAGASLTPSDVPIAATEGQAFSGAVGTFTDSDPLHTPSDFTATINWGDGSVPTAATSIVLNGSTFTVSGSHTWAEEGTYTVSIAVTIVTGGGTPIISTATVADAPLTPSGASITPTEGQAFSNVVVGSFTDANASAPVSDFTATIDWGDGSPVTAASSIVSTGGGGFDVHGGHTYAEEGTYPISIAVADEGGSTATITSTASVADAPLTGPTGVSLMTDAGKALTAVVGSFSDANTAAPVSDFTATVDWGDGSPLAAAGSIVSKGGGAFDVNGSHTYAHGGLFTITVKVNDVGGSSTTVYSQVRVLEPVPVLAAPMLAGLAAALGLLGLAVLAARGRRRGPAEG